MAIPSAATPVRAFAFGPGVEIHAALPLSDGGVLLGGWARDLAWVPSGVPVAELEAGASNSADTGYALLVRLSSDLGEIVQVAHFPQGTVGAVRRLRSTEQPGAATGTIFLSGDRTPTDSLQDGYYLARLAGDLAASTPVAPTTAWIRDLAAPPRRASGRRYPSSFKTHQVWDVDVLGRVVAGRGADADVDSAELVRFDSTGALDQVPQWVSHPTLSGKVWHGNTGAFATTPDAVGDSIRYSRVWLRSGDGQGLRSLRRRKADGTWLDADSSQAWSDDGDGGLQQGAWPEDALASGPCVLHWSSTSGGFGDSVVCPEGSGPGGLRFSSRRTARVGGIVFDRRKALWFVALSWQALAPDGSPVEEPALLCFETEGRLVWWRRLRREADADGLVVAGGASFARPDAVEVDYGRTDLEPTVLVLGHARSDTAFWSGGLDGGIAGGLRPHLPAQDTLPTAAWIARLSQADGTLEDLTWIADPAAASQTESVESDWNGWLAPGDGGETLGGTTCEAGLAPDSLGRVLLPCRGERPLLPDGAEDTPPAPGAAASDTLASLRLWSRSLEAIENGWLPGYDADSSLAPPQVEAVAWLKDGRAFVAGSGASGSTLAVDAPSWADVQGEAWVALYAPAPTLGVSASAGRDGGFALRLRRIGAGWRLEWTGSGEARVQVVDARGRLREGGSARGSWTLEPAREMLWVRVRTAEGARTMAIPPRF